MADAITPLFNGKTEKTANHDGNSETALTKDYPLPFSIRLNDGERAWLEKQAGEKSISAYIRAQLFYGKVARCAHRAGICPPFNGWVLRIDNCHGSL